MSRRKNTAEAFEILLRHAEEKKRSPGRALPPAEASVGQARELPGAPAPDAAPPSRSPLLLGGKSLGEAGRNLGIQKATVLRGPLGLRRAQALPEFKRAQSSAPEARSAAEYRWMDPALKEWSRRPTPRETVLAERERDALLASLGRDSAGDGRPLADPLRINFLEAREPHPGRDRFQHGFEDEGFRAGLSSSARKNVEESASAPVLSRGERREEPPLLAKEAAARSSDASDLEMRGEGAPRKSTEPGMEPTEPTGAEDKPRSLEALSRGALSLGATSLATTSKTTTSKTITLKGIALKARGMAQSAAACVKPLERRLEFKLSTLLVFVLGAAVLALLFAMYLRIPPEDDPLFRGKKWAFAPEAAGAPIADASAGAVAAIPKPFPTPLPLWGPEGLRQAGPASGARAEAAPVQPKPAAEAPEIANTVAAPVEEPSNARPVPAPERQEPPSPYMYLIQVRAKESQKGAQGILDYLGLFGFAQSQTERDSRSATNAEGEALYTVFVGKYFNRDDADRELSRLKEETRLRPYKGRAGSFQDALVITRTR